MHSFSILAVAALAVGAAAAPNGKTTTSKHTTTTTKKTTSTQKTTSTAKATCTGVAHDANFDDLAAVPGSELNQIPDPYMGLYYQSFDYTTVVETNAAPGVIPHSPSNYAAASVTTETNGTPMLTVFYPNSAVQSFDLSSFYFGCVINLAQGATAAPNACNIDITGYTGSDNSVANAQQVCSQQFQYNPSTAVGAQQQAFSGALKSCFDKIQFATVTFTPPGGESALAATLALVLDDIRYTTYSCAA